MLNIVIFGKKDLRKCSTFRYLLYLSIFDMLVLIVCASDAFLRFGYQIQMRQSSQLYCRLHTFFTYFLTHASSSILMVVSVDRALVVNNKAFFFDILRLKKFENIEKKEDHSYFCGLSLCCLLHCGFSSNVIRRVKYKSFMHRIDLIIICLLLVLALLNSHYLLLMNIKPINYSVLEPDYASSKNYSHINNISFIELGSLKKRLDNLKSSEALFCYPSEG